MDRPLRPFPPEPGMPARDARIVEHQGAVIGAADHVVVHRWLRQHVYGVGAPFAKPDELVIDRPRRVDVGLRSCARHTARSSRASRPLPETDRSTAWASPMRSLGSED